MERVILTTKKELEIYMNPVRQQLIRLLEISKVPMTPKMLADKMDISASSVQHHIRKLMSLELLELDHTELINGITARFYKPTYKTVQIGLENKDDTASQREVFLQEKVAQTYDRFIEQKKKILNHLEVSDSDKQLWGDIMTGVLHLTPEESGELFQLISDYVEEHALPSKEKRPWEYALILYDSGEDLHE